MSSTLLLLGLLAPAAGDTGLVVSVTRFYRAEAAQTQVAAFVEAPQVPGSSLAIKVTDATGTPLWDQQWPRVAAAAGEPWDVEHLRFTVGPGTHHLTAVVRDSLQQVLATATVSFDGYAAPPGASDLLVTPRIRSVDVADPMPHPEEFRRGDLLITATASGRIPAAEARLHYLLEAYNGVGGPGTLTVRVEDLAGRLVREAPPAAVRVPPRVAVLTGMLELPTLAAGQYRLRVELVVDGRLLERIAVFEFR